MKKKKKAIGKEIMLNIFSIILIKIVVGA
jgi:hypothetical protein